jgi:hypothetical protein
MQGKHWAFFEEQLGVSPVRQQTAPVAPPQEKNVPGLDLNRIRNQSFLGDRTRGWLDR